MADLQHLLHAIDSLNPTEMNQLHQYVEQRRQIWWVVSPENLRKIDELMRPVQEEAAQMSEEEINTVIDDAIAEGRGKHKKGQQSA